jgi:hypothetical protein
MDMTFNLTKGSQITVDKNGRAAQLYDSNVRYEWQAKKHKNLPIGGDFSHRPDWHWGPTQPPVQWVPGLSRGFTSRGVALTTNGDCLLAVG